MLLIREPRLTHIMLEEKKCIKEKGLNHIRIRSYSSAVEIGEIIVNKIIKERIKKCELWIQSEKKNVAHCIHVDCLPGWLRECELDGNQQTK